MSVGIQFIVIFSIHILYLVQLIPHILTDLHCSQSLKITNLLFCNSCKLHAYNTCIFSWNKFCISVEESMRPRYTCRGHNVYTCILNDKKIYVVVLICFTSGHIHHGGWRLYIAFKLLKHSNISGSLISKQMQMILFSFVLYFYFLFFQDRLMQPSLALNLHQSPCCCPLSTGIPDVHKNTSCKKIVLNSF